MSLLIIRNLIFIILKPGLVVGVIPFFIIGIAINIRFETFQFYHFTGIIIFIIGLIIMLHCIYRFIVEGKGTLSPVDPTKHLVVKGLYKVSRNPMYLGVIIMLIGESLFTQSIYMWMYLLTIFGIFNVFIRFVEEPRLKRDFGEKYSNYYRNVSRWL